MHPVTKFRHKRKQDIYNYLGGKCVVCGTDEKLDIDHIDPSTKSFTLTGNNLNRTWEYLLPEIHKCQLLCKPHHLEKTISELKGREPWNKGINNFDPDSHGNWWSYDIKRCKCNECRLWKKNYRVKKVDTSGNWLL